MLSVDISYISESITHCKLNFHERILFARKLMCKNPKTTKAFTSNIDDLVVCRLINILADLVEMLRQQWPIVRFAASFLQVTIIVVVIVATIITHICIHSRSLLLPLGDEYSLESSFRLFELQYPYLYLCRISFTK